MEEEKDQEMEYISLEKSSSTHQHKKKKSDKVKTSHEEKDVEMNDDVPDTTREETKKKENLEGETLRSKGTKRNAEHHTTKSSELKRRKTDKGEKNISVDKKKAKSPEWQYGKNCARELWIGKRVKVRFPATKEDQSTTFKFGVLLNIKENDEGDKNLFEIKFENDEKEWIDLEKNIVYIFGQILFLKHPDDEIQIGQIKELYGWKGKDRNPTPIPAIELIEVNPHINAKESKVEEINEKIPIQYFNNERAKKIKKELLYEYREFREEGFEIIKNHWKDGDKILNEILNYREEYDKWVKKYSSVDIDMSSSLRKYCSKIVRVYKGDRY